MKQQVRCTRYLAPGTRYLLLGAGYQAHLRNNSIRAKRSAVAVVAMQVCGWEMLPVLHLQGRGWQPSRSASASLDISVSWTYCFPEALGPEDILTGQEGLSWWARTWRNRWSAISCCAWLLAQVVTFHQGKSCTPLVRGLELCSAVAACAVPHACFCWFSCILLLPVCGCSRACIVTFGSRLFGWLSRLLPPFGFRAVVAGRCRCVMLFCFVFVFVGCWRLALCRISHLRCAHASWLLLCCCLCLFHFFVLVAGCFGVFVLLILKLCSCSVSSICLDMWAG